ADRSFLDVLGGRVQPAEVTALVVAGLGAGTKAVDQLAGPCRAALRLEVWNRPCRRIVQDVDDVARAVGDATLLTNDQVDVLTVDLRRRDVARLLGYVVGLPLAALGFVEVVVCRWGGAIGVERAKVRSVRRLQAERIQFA